MKEFKEERKILEEQNTRVDKVINVLSKIKVRVSVKSELLDITREVKVNIANIVRLIDGF